jgi:chromosomal replication initiation ATPase DnaA
MMKTAQLPLPFPHRVDYAAAAFLEAPANAAALGWLSRPLEWPDFRLALWGEAGSGKTHLLHRWAAPQSALILDGQTLAPPSAPPARAVAIDNAAAADERALLHWLNSCAENGHAALLAARAAPGRWPVRLADLASRLRAITAVEIGAADDALLRALLARLLADRQLRVSELTQEWLLSRLPRSQAALREAAQRLDSASLSSGGAVTIALARATLADMMAETGEVM